MLRMGLAPTAMLKCSPDFFRSVAALARRHPGVRLHSHLAEVEKEVHDIRAAHGCSHSEFLKSVNPIFPSSRFLEFAASYGPLRKAVSQKRPFLILYLPLRCQDSLTWNGLIVCCLFLDVVPFACRCSVTKTDFLQQEDPLGPRRLLVCSLRPVE
jgi:hypothetical protein